MPKNLVNFCFPSDERPQLWPTTDCSHYLKICESLILSISTKLPISKGCETKVETLKIMAFDFGTASLPNVHNNNILHILYKNQNKKILWKEHIFQQTFWFCFTLRGLFCSYNSVLLLQWQCTFYNNHYKQLLHGKCFCRTLHPERRNWMMEIRTSN